MDSAGGDCRNYTKVKEVIVWSEATDERYRVSVEVMDHLDDSNHSKELFSFKEQYQRM